MGMGFLWAWVVFLSCVWYFNECFEESFYLFIYLFLTIAASTNILNLCLLERKKKLYLSKWMFIGKHGHICTKKYINLKSHNLTQILVYYLFFIKTILPIWGKIIHQACLLCVWSTMLCCYYQSQLHTNN